MLVLFATVFPCKCFTDESSTLIVQGLSLCRILSLHCSVISSLSEFPSSWSGGSLFLLSKFELTWVLALILLFNWLLLSFFWFLPFSFELAIMAVIGTCCDWYLLLGGDWYLLWISVYYFQWIFSCWSVWVLTSVFLDVMQFECSGRWFEKFSIKCSWLYLSVWPCLSKTSFPFPLDLEVSHISHHISFSQDFFSSSLQYWIVFQGKYLWHFRALLCASPDKN